MKKILTVLFALVALSASAEKLTFVVEGPEEEYNMIKVINETSMDELSCRLLELNEKNIIQSEYGIYYLKGKNDADKKRAKVLRGTRIGIQLNKEVKKALNFTIEYKDMPAFDMIVIHLYDKSAGFNNKF